MAETNVNTLLGQGILTPLRRVGRDFAFGSGTELVESCIRQILSTQKGELRWRPEFGVDLERVRHKNITDVQLAEMEAEVAHAILRWEPRVVLDEISVEQLESDASSVIIRVAWRAVARSTNKNTVLTDRKVTEVTV